MSANESFLARWARRKRGAARKAHAGPTPKKTGDDAAPEAAASLPPEETQSLVDPASLPPIESIGAGSDIRPFLAAGVPADLARAALRRAWSADPAIRDFIGLSENSWDFNAPGAIAGFGSLTAEDARRLVARVMDESEALDSAHPAVQRISNDQASETASSAGRRSPAPNPDQIKLIRDADAARNTATRDEEEERASRPLLQRRHHGGALPD